MESKTVEFLAEVVAVEAFDLGRFLTRQSSLSAGSLRPEFVREPGALSEFIDRLERVTGNCQELLRCRLEAMGRALPAMPPGAGIIGRDGLPKAQAV